MVGQTEVLPQESPQESTSPFLATSSIGSADVTVNWTSQSSITALTVSNFPQASSKPSYVGWVPVSTDIDPAQKTLECSLGEEEQRDQQEGFAVTPPNLLEVCLLWNDTSTGNHSDVRDRFFQAAGKKFCNE